MKKSAKQADPLTARNDAQTRATPEGTARFVERFAPRFTADFYRAVSLGVQVSSIGLGTYLGEASDTDDDAYATAARRAIAGGINLIDTAINYRCQRSERAVGAALQQVIQAGDATRGELVVCTKGGYIPLDQSAPRSREEYQAYVKREFIDPVILRPEEIVGGGHSLAPRFLRYCLAKSRQNLGLRTIDLFYLHNPEQQLGVIERDELYGRIELAFTALEEAADRGDISSYGIATWDGLRAAPDSPGHLSLERVFDAARRVGGAEHRFRAIQLPVNLAMSEAVRAQTQVLKGRSVTVVEAAAELGLTTIGSATLMQARLTSKLPAALHEHFPTLTTDAQRAIAFARTLDGVGASLVGMKSVAHVDENLASARA
jgi:aryl-alcohol dehydrogenase-like predicted oxidoreductase